MTRAERENNQAFMESLKVSYIYNICVGCPRCKMWREGRVTFPIYNIYVYCWCECERANVFEDYRKQPLQKSKV